MIGKGGVGDAGYEAGNVEEIVDFGEVGVGEGMASEAAEDCSGGERAGSEDSFSDFATRAVVSEENDPFLSDQCVDENDDGMSVGAGCCEMCVEREGLR